MQPGTRVKIKTGVYAGKLATVKEPGEYVTVDGISGTRPYRDSALEVVTAPAPAPTPTPSPSGWRLVFEENFDGPAGAPWNPANWINRGDSTDGHLGQCASRAANVFLDGQGHGIIRTKRESFLGHAFTTGEICTFSYGYGAAGNTAADGAWPPQTVLRAWPTPHRVEVVKRIPTDLAGGWGGSWAMGVTQRRPTTGVPELDFGEVRFGTGRHDAHQHLWKWNATLGKVEDIRVWSSPIAAAGSINLAEVSVECRRVVRADLQQWHR
jgi:hypothetical protein